MLVPSALIVSYSTVRHVTLNASITVPAASEVEAMAQLSAEGAKWLVEGMHHDKLLIVRVVVTPSANCVPNKNHKYKCNTYNVVLWNESSHSRVSYRSKH